MENIQAYGKAFKCPPPKKNQASREGFLQKEWEEKPDNDEFSPLSNKTDNHQWP